MICVAAEDSTVSKTSTGDEETLAEFERAAIEKYLQSKHYDEEERKMDKKADSKRVLQE